MECVGSWSASSFIFSRSSAAAVKCCTACQGIDHTTNQCALASIEPAVQQAGVEPCCRGYICTSWNRGLAASLVLAATAMCAPFALGPTKPGNAHRQGATRLHLKLSGVIRPHLSNDWWIPIVGLVIYGIYPFHLFHSFIYSIDCML